MSHMRIIGGEFRGRLLNSPPEDAITRPMPARVRESLFGMFRGHTQDATVFDTFSGTGSFGLEAISRGAVKAVFVEKDKSMAKVLRQNAETLGVLDKIEIFEGDALGAGALSRCPRPVTLVLLDPPYPLVQEPMGWQRVKLQAEKLVQCLSDDGFLVLRVPHPFVFGPSPDESTALPPRPVKRKKIDKRWSERELEREERESMRGKKPGIAPPIDLGDGDDTSEYIDLDLDSLTDEQIEQLDAMDEANAAEATKAAAATAIPTQPALLIEPVSVELKGARGPETHIYGTMAVHLYMKA